MSRLLFELPDDDNALGLLVDAIPPTWTMLNGRLFPTLAVREQETVVDDTGYLFSTSAPSIVGRRKGNGQRARPDVLRLVIGRLAPGFVEFENAGYFRNSPSLGEVREVAAGYVHGGYRGKLDFVQCALSGSVSQVAARCRFRLARADAWPWPEPSPGADDPLALGVEWNELYGGRAEHCTMVLRVCRSLDLRELASVA